MSRPTQKWCPECEKIRDTRVVNLSLHSAAYRSGQRFYRTDHPDIHWFRRGLECLDCGHEWLSAEVPEDFITELVQLRDALQQVKQNAEAYSKDAENAAKGLAKLSQSLSDLKALEIYIKQT